MKFIQNECAHVASVSHSASLSLPLQLVSFGLSNQLVVTFKEENLMTLQHLFLKDYADGGMDTYAIYRQADVYDHIEYIITQVRQLYRKKQQVCDFLHNTDLFFSCSITDLFPLLLCYCKLLLEFYNSPNLYDMKTKIHSM